MSDRTTDRTIDALLAPHVSAATTHGAVWLLDDGHDVRVGALGVTDPDGRRPVERDTIFRIASMTKPVVAVGAMVLVEDGRLDLDTPVDRWLPELADRRVMVEPMGALTDTVPAVRAITVHDLMTSLLGVGIDLAGTWPQPIAEAMRQLGLLNGPPAPAIPPAPDEWMRRFATLPLQYQPGTRYLYHVASDVLAVLVARAADRPLEEFLAERIFDPLGMVDTGFSVRPDQLDRFGHVWSWGDDGVPVVYDAPDGQWSVPPAFPSGGGGLVSTVDDVHAFGRMLDDAGAHPGGRVLSESSVARMTTDHLDVAQRAASGLGPGGATGWGFGLAVHHRGSWMPEGAYGWNGGLGTAWANLPGRIGVILTNRAFAGAGVTPPVIDAFWAAVS